MWFEKRVKNGNFSKILTLKDHSKLNRRCTLIAIYYWFTSIILAPDPFFVVKFSSIECRYGLTYMSVEVWPLRDHRQPGGQFCVANYYYHKRPNFYFGRIPGDVPCPPSGWPTSKFRPACPPVPPLAELNEMVQYIVFLFLKMRHSGFESKMRAALLALALTANWNL